MKALAIICLMGFTAAADPCRFEFRNVSGHDVDLAPVFNWWNYVSKASLIASVDITQVPTNSIAGAVSNVWSKLPAKPMVIWCRIQSAQITVVGDYWQLDADIYLAPQIKRHAKILLAHPPVNEIQNLNWAKSRLDFLGRQQQSDYDVASDADSDYRQDSVEGHRISMLQQAFPYNTVLPSQMASAAQDQSRAENTGNKAESRIALRGQQIAFLVKFVETYPGRKFAVDHFAFRTGKTINGMEVFDVGLADGLNYSIQ